MGKVRNALFYRPILHRIGDDIGGLAVESFAELYALSDLLINLFRQPSLHHGIVKNHGAEHLA